MRFFHDHLSTISTFNKNKAQLNAMTINVYNDRDTLLKSDSFRCFFTHTSDRL